MTDWDVMLVSHEASRTGAPRVAVNTVEWLVKAGLRVVVIVRTPGPMMKEFTSIGASVYAEPMYALRILFRRFQTTKKLARLIESWAARIIFWQHRPNKVYFNSVLSLSYANEAIKCKIPVIVHLHETGELLEGGLRRYPLDAKQASQITWIACAFQATQTLMERYPGNNVLHWPSCVDQETIRQSATLPHPPLPNKFILGVGKGNSGKGFDIWLRLCRSLATSQDLKDIDFVWAGHIEKSTLDEVKIGHEIKNRIFLLGELSNPYPVICNAILLTVTSRAEASPLVTLEAQALGVPVVAFDVGDIKHQIPPHHLVRAEDEAELLLTVQRVLNEQPPVLAYDNSRHGIDVARRRALQVLAHNTHPRIDS